MITNCYGRQAQVKLTPKSEALGNFFNGLTKGFLPPLGNAFSILNVTENNKKILQIDYNVLTTRAGDMAIAMLFVVIRKTWWITIRK